MTLNIVNLTTTSVLFVNYPFLVYCRDCIIPAAIPLFVSPYLFFFVVKIETDAAHIMSFWSSATDPNRDSCRRCQDTSSTTAVWPVKMVLASTIFPSLGTVLMSHRQIVCQDRGKETHTHSWIRWERVGTKGITIHNSLTEHGTYVIIRSTEEAAAQVWVPWETVTFLLMAP